MSEGPLKIAVVIPYFQRERGLLRRCVQSVLDWRAGLSICVIVVDDGSPLPADEEIGDLLDDGEIVIVRKENGGPGAARNTGLDHVPRDIPFVAFLDSDDQWIGPFLGDAVRALGRGFDLFIGDTQRTGISRTRFQWADSPEDNIHPEDHPLIDPEHGLYEFAGDFFDLLVRRSSIISANAMAYRLDRFSRNRFPEGLMQGEDRFFKLQLGQSLRRVAFSPRIYADEGEGVNIFDKSGWKTEGYVRLTSNYIALARMVLEEIRLDEKQRAFVRGQLADSRRSFVAAVLHQLRHRKPLDWSLVRATLRRDPLGAGLFLPNILRLALGRLGQKGGRPTA
ncbi:glycosyltransferase family 2 protein [Thioalkalivibrio sp. ALMg3]|uniref:glycosyltransferase family 2 protein n=1 Tax=Thioalkalivibrio sp. ALMg3 TaxID=1158163 RepID=UPI00037F318C|nr:glycosyltransferase family 2 protein [Thioalkalivibrio sp. ALMg3]